MLFNKRLLQTHLNNFEYPSEFDFERAEKIVGNWQKAIRDGNYDKTKEIQVQSSFLNLFFNIILGYAEMHDNSDEWFLINEAKTEFDGTKADGALGYFTKDEKTNITRAVIELKDAKTNLDSKQSSRKDYASPISQAFSYSSKFDRCDWIIVSNFKEIRLYNKERGQGYFESFEIINLHDEKEFKRFYFLLCKQNLLDKNRKSLLDSLIKNTTKNEEEISKQFYKDFKVLRQELFQHICAYNTDIDKKTLLEKTQKLLDRLIFIFFCEDTSNLLPRNITRTVYDLGIKSRERSDTRIWREFKNLFMDIDEGRHDIDPPINAYNGGLFATDKILENLIIKDDVWANIIKLSDYDFESDLNVNILGHIFEQSLSDLEQIKAEIDGIQGDKTKSKRKKDGIFYTPEYITKYIVEQTVGKYLEENPDKLETIKILDPACGSGAFLNQAHTFLKTQYEIRNEERLNEGRGFSKEDKANIEFRNLNLTQHINIAETDRSILLNNLYGVDLNEESTEITKLALWLKTAKKDQPLQNLDNNIKCGNSLIDDPNIAGDKAFQWEKEFGNKLLTQGHDPVFKEKEQKAFHITFKTYNSFSAEAEGILLSTEDEKIVLNEICNVIKDDKIRVLAINICSNHVHMVLVCEQDEIETYIQKIKSVSSRNYNIIKGKTIADKETTMQLPKSEKTQNRLWAKGYNVSFIETDEELENKVNYVQYNRQKHKLSDVPELRVMTLSPQVLTPYEQAFAPQYKGGFDCIIGNPPYFNIDTLGCGSPVFEHLKSAYSDVYMDKSDILFYFIKKAIDLLNNNGIMGFIISNAFLFSDKAKKLRNYILEQSTILEILNFEQYYVFKDAGITSCILILQKNNSSKTSKCINLKEKDYSDDEILNIVNNQKAYLDVEFKKDSFFSIMPKHIKELENKIKLNAQKLSDIYHVGRGMETGANNVYIFDEYPNQFPSSFVKNRISSEIIHRYSVDKATQYLLYFEDITSFEELPTAIQKHLLENKSMLENRADKKRRKTSKWWNYTFPIHKEYYNYDKIWFSTRANDNKFIYDDKNNYVGLSDSGAIFANNSSNNLKFILALLNSNIMRFMHKNNAKYLGGSVYEYVPSCIEKLPIAKTTADQQTSLANKAQQMIELNKQLREGVKSALGLLDAEYGLRTLRTEGHDPQPTISKKLEKFHTLGANIFLEELEKQGVKLSLSKKEELLTWYNQKSDTLTDIKNQIDTLDHSIDQEVYKLYNLTEDEIKIIEGE